MPGRDETYTPVNTPTRIESLFRLAAGADRLGMTVLRLGLILVLVWIGALKVAEYEADGIVPFVANSPFMSFVYTYDAPEYRQYMNREGELIPANRAWHEANGTYTFSYLLGSVIVLYGLLIAAHHGFPWLSGRGRLVVKDAIMMGGAIVTLADSARAWLARREAEKSGLASVAA